MVAIELENVSLEYKLSETESVIAIDDVNLSINQGDFVAVIGHNGSGKSTLAKMLNGLILPQQGVVKVFGMQTDDESKIFEIRKNLGMVFQNPDNQMIASIIEDDIAFGPENLGIPREEIIKRVEWALKTVDMYDYKNATPFKLSGGQKQRIAIAGVLAMLPKCIVLDESTAMLDPKGRAEVLQVAKALNKEVGMTVILITHYMEEALEADRLIVMNKGKIIADDRPNIVFGNIDLLKSVNLSIPLVTKIAIALKENGLDVDPKIVSNEELVERLCQLL